MLCIIVYDLLDSKAEQRVSHSTVITTAAVVVVVVVVSNLCENTFSSAAHLSLRFRITVSGAKRQR